MRILITGGSGFIGNHVTKHIASQVHKIAVIDKKNRQSSIGVEFLKADINSDESERFACQFKPEVVVHLAALASVVKSFEDPLQEVKDNVLATVKLAEISNRINVKQIIFTASAGSLYGDSLNGLHSEEDGQKPLSPYAVGKMAAEKYLRVFCKKYGIQLNVLRLANIYGANQSMSDNPGIITILLNNAINGKTTKIYGDGMASRDFLYMSDLLAAIDCCLKTDESDYYNIAYGNSVTINQVIKVVEAVTKKTLKIEYQKARAGELQAVKLSNQKAKRLLGWQPTITLENGIKEIVMLGR